MKSLTSHLFFCLLLVGLISCTKEINTSSLNNEVIEEIASTVGTSGSTTVDGDPMPYIVALENITNNGTSWTWMWSVQNPIPGNGLNGTAQNLSHWGFVLASCIPWSNVGMAGYSFDGENWTNFTPVNAVDPSQNCYTQPIIKFDAGTSGNQKTYYRIDILANYPVNYNTLGYYKSGSRTRCDLFMFPGIACDDIREIHE